MPRTTPSWMHRLVIYEVFPRLHSASGDFAGVQRDLPRIKELGMDILYLMPIFPMGDNNNTDMGSPYGIYDHRAINQSYGTESDLRALVEASHALGIKVILDVVLHHLSSHSRLAQDRPDWFLKDADGKLMCKVPAWTGCVDLDYRIPEVWDYQIGTLQRWLDLGMDGFRFDVVPLVPIEFWDAARRTLDPRGEQIWLAETGFMQFVKKDKDLGIIHHSDPELHQVFDITYDADGAEYLYGYFRGDNELKDYLHQVYLQEVLYPANAPKLRYLENHDDMRIAAKLRDPNALKCWTAMMMLLPGPALVYAGQEMAIGIDREVGSRGQEHYHRERHNVPWESGHRDFEQFFVRLVGIVKQIKSECHVCKITQDIRGICKIDWTGPESRYTAILNLENRFGNTGVDWQIHGQDLLTNRPAEISGTYTIQHRPVIIQHVKVPSENAHRGSSQGKVITPQPVLQTAPHAGADWSTALATS